MNDLISRQAAIDLVEGLESARLKGKIDLLYPKVVKGLIGLPSAQPERKTGWWIESNPQNSEICRLIDCSECGKGYIVNINVSYEDWTDAHKFCVECGAKMGREIKI